ncbi:hypothetical protein R1T43_19810 [Alteromonas sp. CI.11.F.A3]|uniref:esterase/lipase family protein n=1 Tax=Alteromonas sp. CI.11.F.A3 TaxID=3079555 RepID=UPI00294231B2|nr:hypothetical protein [Alteromonas sp. CI.11.F.A3]WOI37408.1 hypothetical protein R1T43_19810 [Alteromonas sp. CI.11.F.A3]
MNKFVIFVHGLGGKVDKTWGNFPQYLIDDITISHKVIEYGYTSPHLVKQFFKSGPTILNIANGLLSDIKAQCNLENDEIVLVGHSMGGVVIKRLLVRLSKLGLKHNIKKICFFDVPHGGSGLANIGKYIALRNRHLRSLVNNSSDLDALDEDWVDQKLSEQLNILSIIDANETVVSSVSSKSMFRYHQIETINDVNHSTIVKPSSENETVVLLLKSFIKNSVTVGKLNLDLAKPIRDWLKYHERKHELAYEEDEARREAFLALSAAMNSESCFVRLTGLSGLGKSRLLLEYKNRSNLEDDTFVIFNGAENNHAVEDALKSVSESGAEGIVIIDNCSVELHNYATNAFGINKSPLKLVTTYFYHEETKKLKNSIRIKLEKLGADSVTNIIDSRLPELTPSLKKQLEKFIEGFPLLAQMTIKELQQEGQVTTAFDESDLVEKLINGDGTISAKNRELLKVFSLFDYFRFQKAPSEDVNEDAEFLKRIAGVDQITFENTITTFNQKELINCTGSLARVVPKPLALNLAMEWWRSSALDRQREIVLNLPDMLTDSFCDQIRYLDSSVNVQSFVEDFCSANRPFGQAELLLSKQGSRLFRALVEVNPAVTNMQLYRVFTHLTDSEIAAIDGDVRRNLVWALEMLVFHQSCFDKAAWCLFKLAQYENENFSNNAQGQFSQLFRWQLSGTEADFNQRLTVLNRALALNIENADTVIIEAVKSAIDNRGGSRTIGAEFQGTRAALEEWMPKRYEEIYDYWQNLLIILVVIVRRERLVEQVKDAFGQSIRGLIRFSMPERLDSFVKEVVALTGKYWPSAAQSITHALHYDIEGMKPEQKALLESWGELLAPDKNSVEEKLKLIVLDPSKEYIKDDSGEYRDLAAEDAIQLAKEFKSNFTGLYQYFNLLMTFSEQKQSWIFGKQLIAEIDSVDEFFDEVLEYLRSHNGVITRFFSGLLSGLYSKDLKKWKVLIEAIGTEEKLIEYYPDAIVTGKLEVSNLDVFIALIKAGSLPSHTALILIYGKATEHLSEKDVANFCSSLSKVDAIGTWVALEIVNIYAHGRNDIDFTKIAPTTVHLVLHVSFNKNDRVRQVGSYHWLKSVNQLLKSQNAEFSLKLCVHIINQVNSSDVSYSEVWDYLREAFYKAFEVNGSYIWPKIKDRFTDRYSSNRYKLLELLGSGNSHRGRDTCIFDILEANAVVDWCNDELALLIVARSISMFINRGEERVVNPLILMLIAEFYDSKSFLNEISANFSSRSWVGSLIPHLQSDKDVITPLKQSENANIRNWASYFIDNINQQIDREAKRELEDKIRMF